MEAIITQARINSSRLPNKIFLEAGGKSFFSHHIERLKKTGLPIIVATTDNGSEKPIVDFCRENNLLFYCGDEQYVLKRFYDCAQKFKVKTIVRVTSDCPLIDADVIRNGIDEYRKSDNDNVFYSNATERTYPRGMDYEIFSFKLLEDAYLNADDPSEKEHVSPYMSNNRSGTVIMEHDFNNENNSDLRITLDTQEDRELITELIEKYKAESMSCEMIVKVLRNNPELIEINKLIEQKKV